MPLIAVILELCDNPAVKSIGKESNTTLKACAWAQYRYSYAQRMYSASTNPAAANATAILRKLRSDKLLSPFKYQDIYGQKWSGLTTGQTIISTLGLLQTYGWIQEDVIKSVTGRPSIIYHVHPWVCSDASTQTNPPKSLKRHTHKTHRTTFVGFVGVSG